MDPVNITSFHLPVEDLANDIVNLVTTQYPDVPWPKTDQALRWAQHQLMIRAQSYETPPETPPAP